jgi:hypothetical protein
VKTTSSLLGLAALLAACSGSHSGDSSPGTAQSSSTGPTEYVSLRLDNTLCLPRPLPTAADGTTTCRVLALLPSGTCEAAGGLTPAPDADLATLGAELANAGSTVKGPLCVVPQRPARCADEDGVAFCYTPGSCVDTAPNPCAQALCTTTGFADALPKEAFLFAACPGFVGG